MRSATIAGWRFLGLDHFLLDCLSGRDVSEWIDQDPGSDYLVRILGPVTVLEVPLGQSEHVVDGVAHHLAEDGVLALQLSGGRQGEEEL